MHYLLAFHLLIAILYAIFVPLEVAFPGLSIRLIRFHARSRKLVLPLLLGLSALFLILLGLEGALGSTDWILFGLQVFFTVLGIRLHQDVVFEQVGNPEAVSAQAAERLTDSTKVVVVAANGTAKAYPLTYVAHNHVVNDRVGGQPVAVTFCPMCHLAIAYDTAGLGPLYVATLHSGNLVLADFETDTYWQQGSGEYLAGPKSDVTLQPLAAAVLTWAQARAQRPEIVVVQVSERDLMPFRLPVPGLWQRVINSEFVPTLPRDHKDERLPARQLVIGIALFEANLAYLKDELLAAGLIYNTDHGFALIAQDDAVRGYQLPAADREPTDLRLGDGTLADRASGGEWHLDGRAIAGGANLTPLPISEEYWFSWAQFHPMTQILHVPNNAGSGASPAKDSP